MEKIKIGIIGVGNISHSHIKSYLADERVELYAFCDIDEARLKFMGEKYGVTRLYTDIDEMLSDKEIAAVSVCTWNNAHAECSIKALKAGKHVLCEKPMAYDLEQALKMQQVAKETGKTLMIGFVRRFGADCELLKEYTENGTFGDFYYAKVMNLRRHGNPGGWFGDKSRSGGGPLIDIGVHIIDFVSYVFGNVEPVSVYGVTFKKLLNRPDVKDKVPYSSQSAKPGDKCDVEDLAAAMIRFDNGAVINVEVSFSLNLPQDKTSIEMFGTKGGATMNPDLTISTELNNRMVNINPCAKSGFDFSESFRKEISHFIDCFTEGTPCRNPAKDGVKLMKILDAIYESAETGHEVILK